MSSRQITYGPNQYVFTNQAKTKVNVTAAAKHAKVKKAQKIRFSGKVTPTAPSAKVTLEVKKNGKWVSVKSRTLAASGEFRFGAKPDRLGTLRFRVSVSRDQLHRSGQEQHGEGAGHQEVAPHQRHSTRAATRHRGGRSFVRNMRIG